ncbi:MAK10-like protein [Tanacetum coccineum]
MGENVYIRDLVDFDVTMSTSKERGDGVTGIKRRRRDPSSDGVKDLVMASGHGRLNEDLESSSSERRRLQRTPRRALALVAASKSIFSLCYLFGNLFSSTTMGDEDPIRTIGDYSKPSHEGYRNTIELPVGNNVMTKLMTALKTVDGENRERTRLRLFQFSLRDQASNWLEHLLAGSITTWEDLTTRFLAQFFPPRRTVKLRNDILMFQQHHGESLSEAWTHFKDLLQKKVPHMHMGGTTHAGGMLRDQNAKESWALLEDLALYDNESWNDPRDFTKPVKAIALPQDVPSTSDCRLIELENQVQFLMEAHLAPTQPTQVNKITTSLLKAITDRIAGALPSDTVKNPKLSTSPVLFARSYPTMDPHCSTHVHGSINVVMIHPKQQRDSHDDRTEENEEEEKVSPENINANPSTPPNPSVSFISEKVLKLNSFFESLRLVPQSSSTELVCTKGDDDDVMFIEIIKKYDDSHEEEPEAREHEDFSTWMAFEGNSCNLGSFGEETDEITDLHQIHEEILFLERGDGVTDIKRRRRDPSSDNVRYLVTASGHGRLNDDLESSINHGHLEEIVVKRSDQQLYKFKEGDFVDLHLNDIEDMLLLAVQHKLLHLDASNIVDFIVALCMFARILILKRRVEDLQLGVERIIYEDLNKPKRVLQADELFKFSDGTLKSVRDEIYHKVLDFRLDYNTEMPTRKWTAVDRKRSGLMIELIDKQLREREIIINLERLVGAGNSRWTTN